MQQPNFLFHKPVLLLSILLFFLFFCPLSRAGVVTQFVPTLIISEEYSDNYFRDSDNEQEEFITSVGLGFSLGFIEKRSKIYLRYNPEYLLYKNLDDRDGLEHNVFLDGEFNLTKKTDLTADLAYTTRDEKLAGESWENSANATLTSRLTRQTTAHVSQSYTNRFDEQVRTGNYTERDVNRTAAGIVNQFGKKDRAGLDLSYEFDDYKNDNADEYTEYGAAGFITWWLTPLNGIESNIAYEKTDFDILSDDIDIYRGDIRYIRSFTPHFNGYVQYSHTYAEQDFGDHQIFHPSVGFDWEVTEDSGISLGIGLLFSRWEDDSLNDDETDPFLELDAYKIFHFSRRGSLAITGTSGYGEYNEDAASLGYSIYYRAGAQLNYQLRKQLSSNVFASYERDEYSETLIDRTDNTINVGAGLSWMPRKWMQVNLTVAHTDFNTDDDLRGDYTENTAFLSVSLIPTQPVQMASDPTRQDLQNTLFRY